MNSQGLNCKKLSIFLVILLGLVTGGTGCSTSSTPEERASTGDRPVTTEASAKEIQTAIVTDFADKVVIPTYQRLVQKTDGLSKSVDAFVANPNEDTLQAARDAWKKTRVPWEQSEAFAFGPAESLGYDGDLDDWPVNETDVVAVLQSKANLTPETVKTLQTTQKGFHTIEYLLFGVNNDKQASDFSARELQLLALLTSAFDRTAKDLTQSWAEGIEDKPAYREVLATAGDSTNTSYPQVNAALEEIVRGMIGCLDEVANEKMGEPIAQKSTKDLESRFSHTSLDDFKNNIRSVENAYLSKAPESSSSDGKSLSDLVSQTDPELDKQVKSEIQAALTALDAVPNPIEPNIGNAEALAKLEAAQQAILTAYETMEQQVLPLVRG